MIIIINKSMATRKKATNPWQIASQRIVQLRFEIEGILDDFSDEDKNTDQYHDLLETLNLLMGHALEERGINTIVKRKWKKRGISVTILIGGAAIAEITKMIIEWVGLNL